MKVIHGLTPEEVKEFNCSKHRDSLLYRNALDLTVFELTEIGNFLQHHHNWKGAAKFELPATYALELTYKRAKRDNRSLSS